MMKKVFKWQSLTFQVIFALIVGALLGLIINLTGARDIAFVKDFVIFGAFDVGGQIFMRLLQLVVVPVVLVSLISGTAGLGDIAQLGRIGSRTLLIYILTTILALAIAITVAILIGPGRGFELSADAIKFEGAEAPPLSTLLVNLVPKNPIDALASGNMLQVIFLSILIGMALTLTGAAGKRILSIVEDLNVVVMKIVGIVIMFSPVGVFCLIAKVFSEQGLVAVMPLAKYFFTVLALLLVHLFVVYCIILKTFTGLSPVQYLRNIYDLLIFAFSTSSSNATIPVTMDTTENKLGVSNSVTSFVVPLGATLNMDGTSIMQGVATVFVAQAYGIDLSLSQYLMVIFTATLATIGTAGVPAVGLIMLSMVFNQVGLPVEGIGIIMAVDRLLDMTRTMVNVAGDSMVACVIGKSEKQLDEDIFYGRKAPTEEPVI